MQLQTVYRPIVATNQTALKNSLIVVLASIVLAVISQIALPVGPVPLTFQSAMVVLLGLTLGSKRAFAAVVLYLFEGAIGFPVFAGGAFGFAALIGPSAGFLWSFPAAAFVAGFLMEKGLAKNYLSTLLSSVVATVVLFASGFAYLAILFGYAKAFAFGVAPFLLTEPLKLMVASLIAKKAWKKQD